MTCKTNLIVHKTLRSKKLNTVNLNTDKYAIGYEQVVLIGMSFLTETTLKFFYPEAVSSILCSTKA